MYKDFSRIVPKIGTNIYICSISVPNFSPIKACVPELERYLCLCEKKKNEEKNPELWSFVFQKWLARFISNLECSLPL